jgi:hypothetical protein
MFDTNGITDGVGVTALAVAAYRASETDADNSLSRDEFAQCLVCALGPAWAQLAGGDLGWPGPIGPRCMRSIFHTCSRGTGCVAGRRIAAVSARRRPRAALAIGLGTERGGQPLRHRGRQPPRIAPPRAAARRSAWREQSARIRRRLGLTMDMDSMTYNGEQRRQLGRPLPADLAEASVTSDLFTAERANGGE